MSAEALQVAKAYRHLLKAVKNNIAKDASKPHFVEYVSEEFRNNCNLSDISSIQQKIKLARDYTYLLNSVHHHKDLLFSYNIAVDRSAEMKRVLGKSAASVGLQLPESEEVNLRAILTHIRSTIQSLEAAANSAASLASFMGSETFLEVILAILLPPVGVFLRYGCGVEFLICFLLTLLGYIPGIIYAIYVLVG